MISLDTHFESKSDFFEAITWYFLKNHQARQCNLIKGESLQSVSYEASPYPVYQFNLGFTHLLEVQLGMNETISGMELERIALLMQKHFTLLHFREVETKLLELSNRDEVTNLYNQRKLLSDLDQAIARFEENEIPFSLLFIDIDHFKQVNDNHGHLMGSHLLVQVGDVIKSTVRQIDSVYRYGGDEFVVLLPKATADDGMKIGQRILEVIKSSEFVFEDQIRHLSVSIGVSDSNGRAKTREDVIKQADMMMYTAKKSGRGQVVHCA